MYFKNLFRTKSIISYIRLGVILGLSIAALRLFAVYAVAAEDHITNALVPLVVIFLALTIAGETTLFLFDNDFLCVALAVIPVFAFGFFATDWLTLHSVMEYLQKIRMDARPEDFNIIVTIAAVLLITAIVAVTACFLKRVKKEAIDL